MNKTMNTSEIYTELINQAKNITEQVSLAKREITELANKLDKVDLSLDILEDLFTDSPGDECNFIELFHELYLKKGADIMPPVTRKPEPQTRPGIPFYRKDTNIIPFEPLRGLAEGNLGSAEARRGFTKQDTTMVRKAGAGSVAPKPVNAAPGKPLPNNIEDYRPLLQRNGLILLSWDKQSTEMGDRYTAYWVTSVGVPRFFASKAIPSEFFFLARPDHKSYAAEDGIDFYGQKAPELMVHVAPELMMHNPRHGELRAEHIKTLRQLGSEVDFDFKFLLTAGRKRRLLLRKPSNDKEQRTGA
jgi:hypothetical protein